MNYSIELNEKLDIPELGLYFSFFPIAPDGSRYGAWPYCLSYEVKSLDLTGLGTYGCNVRIDNPKDVNRILNHLIAAEGDRSREAIELWDTADVTYYIGHHYRLELTSEGGWARGLWFESWRDIECYVARVFIGQAHIKNLKGTVYGLNENPIGHFEPWARGFRFRKYPEV